MGEPRLAGKRVIVTGGISGIGAATTQRFLQEGARVAVLDLRQDAVDEYSVLSPLQQKRLAHHQKKFARSHTFYKPHETTTHYAFS